MTYTNENTGVLFRDDKRTNDRAPEFTGKWTDENGKEWRLAAWVKEGQSGKKFFSLKASPFQARQDADAGAADLDDGSDLPF